MMALSESEKVQRDAEAIAVRVLSLEPGDDIRFFDPDGRDPAELAAAVQALVTGRWTAQVNHHQVVVERIIELTPEDGHIE
jgi:hypothetical protein